MFENSVHGRISKDTKRARLFILSYSLLWMAFWYTGLVVLYLAEPRPRFFSVWIGISLLVNWMTGAMAGSGKSAKGELCLAFGLGLPTSVFGLLLTFMMEHRTPQAIQVWIPGMVLVAIGYCLAIVSFFVRLKLVSFRAAQRP